MTANGYRGNPSLPNEVKQRVTSTFKQTVDLYRDGKLEEVIVGCDLILEMDERFKPAQDLRDKALDPSLPIDVDSLLGGGKPADVDVDSEILSAVEAMNRRDFQAAIDLCNSVLAAEPDNQEAQKLGAKAYERLEAAPFVEQFIGSCRGALAAGRVDEARTALEKAKSLDPLHPDIKDLDAQLSAPQPQDFDIGTESTSQFASAFGSSADDAFSIDQGPAESAPPTPPAEPEEPPAVDFAADAFVVDTPATEGDSSAATDYGFTFEEEPAAPSTPTASPEPSEPPPPPEPKIGEAQTFDFSDASVTLTSDDQTRIKELLAEGDAAFDRSDYQGAIDSWSKIFLIDVTNDDASARIERAKAKRDEAQSTVDTALQAALTEYENKDYQSARKHFEEVLAADPDNFTATEHLEKLADLEAAMQAEAASGAAQITPPPPKPPAADLFDDEILSADLSPGAQEPVIPPPPAPKPKPSQKAAAPSPAPKKKVHVPMAAVAVVALLVVGGGGWFGYNAFFGGTRSSTTQTASVLKQAQALADDGKFSDATKLLLAVGPDDPLRDKALEMIADIKNRQKAAAGKVGGRPAAAVFNGWLAKGREAYEANDFVAAKKALEQAASIKELPPEIQKMYDDSNQRVAELSTATNLFREGNYQEAIRSIENILQTDPHNANAIQMLADAHFDLGVNALRENRLKDAAEEFGKSLEIKPDDETAKRSRDLAQRYEGETKDLLFRIYVKYLPVR